MSDTLNVCSSVSLPGIELVRGDCLDQGSLPRALTGVHTAYYLVHSMGSSGKLEDEDRQAARNFAASARQAGVHRIIYLGVLGARHSMSAHLRSRQEAADILRSSGVPTIATMEQPGGLLALRR
ncbi:MAG: NAD(P)H-binding protein [Candidatus Sulfotelmatobacter sp.]